MLKASDCHNRQSVFIGQQENQGIARRYILQLLAQNFSVIARHLQLFYLHIWSQASNVNATIIVDSDWKDLIYTLFPCSLAYAAP